MKSVVMIAYWFPPEGNAAAYRPLRFLRNLPSFGWRGRVIAGGNQFERYDQPLLRQVPEGTEVTRVVGQDVWQWFQKKRGEQLRSNTAGTSGPAALDSGTTLRSGLRSIVRQAESRWYHPDMQRPWIRPAVKATLASVARTPADVLWATGPPWSTFKVAERVAGRTGVPYVLDFRTSWTIVPSPFEAMRPRWAQKKDRRALSRLLKHARAVTFFYAAEAECFWRLYGDALDASRIHLIPNGFDGAVDPYVSPQTDKFTILYTGTLCDYRYDTFLEALSRFKKTSPGARAISVEFVGEMEPSLMQRVKQLDLSDVVAARPPVPHGAVDALQRTAHALLMLERKPTHKGHELLAGAKLFGYLRAGRPILGVVPPGEAERILRDVGVSTVADAASVDAIVAVLENLFHAWSVGRLSSLVPDATACERYSATHQTAALARALDGLPALAPFVPGAVDVVPSLRAEFAAAGLA